MRRATIRRIVAPDMRDEKTPLHRTRSMPTLTACAAACLALLVAVGLQAPAVSGGLRWRPGPRSRTLDLFEVDLGEGIELPDFGPRADSWPPWVTWVLAALVGLIILAALLRFLRRRMRRAPASNVARMGADSGMSSEADARILQSGLAAAIDILTAEHREPGDAVVQAWQGLQDAAAAAGVIRRPAETASEFTARILYRSRRSAGPIAAFLSLYQRVRFGEHTPTADEIAAARDALTTLVNLWQSDFPERRSLKVAR